ncbi:hypothetical protein [Hymenobacter volaticus]|nr:hypothetical protein [Hymenobacter volaticus]
MPSQPPTAGPELPNPFLTQDAVKDAWQTLSMLRGNETGLSPTS